MASVETHTDPVLGQGVNRFFERTITSLDYERVTALKFNPVSNTTLKTEGVVEFHLPALVGPYCYIASQTQMRIVFALRDKDGNQLNERNGT